MTNSIISSDALSNAIEGGPVFDRMLIYSEEDWAHMRQAAGLFRGIQRLEPRSRARSLATERAAFILNMDRSTVYRLLKKFDGEIVHLFPRRPGPSQGIACLSNAREAAIQIVLHRDYLTKQKISVAELVRRIKKACDGKGLKPVSRKAVQARIDRLDQHMVAVRRGELGCGNRASTIASLSRLEREDIRGLPELAAYLHSYGLASHLLHADCTALDLIHDRAIRPPGEEALLASAQLCRIFTDVVGLQCYCAEAVRAMLGRDFKDRERLYRLVWRCFELSSPIVEAFYDTQADFYGRHGRSEFSDGQT